MAERSTRLESCKRKIIECYEELNDMIVGSTSESSPKRSGREDNSSTSRETSSSNESQRIHEVPMNTSMWSEEDFSKIKVTVASHIYSPNEIYYTFTNFINDKEELDLPTMLSALEEEMKKASRKIQFTKYVLAQLCDLDSDTFYDIPYEELKELSRKIDSSIKDTRDRLLTKAGYRAFTEGDFEELDFRISETVRAFIHQLIYMKEMLMKSGDLDMDVDEDKNVHKGMFLELFVRFSKIFGLEVMCKPNIRDFEFVAFQDKVTARPAGVIHCPLLGDQGILAVVEVTREYSKEEDIHVDSKLMGQHTGEMIATLPNSMFGEKGIFGFIVQGTEVTVVSLHAETNYRRYLEEGRFPQNYSKGVHIKYSRKCNMLNKEGRLALVDCMFHLTDLLSYLRLSKQS